MSSIAIITARGGSKRIPKKNIKEFCGKPILAYSIEAALESQCFDTVMVSTDDEEIAKVALEYGAEVPFFRSDKNSNDYATTSDALVEVLQAYANVGKIFNLCMCIYPTAPFVTAEKIRNAMSKLQDKEVDSVVPVVRFGFPPQRGFVKNLQNETLQYKWPENERARSQDLEPMYHDCGQFYGVKVDKFLECKSLIMKKTRAILVDELEVQDIDTLTDWYLAEIKYKLMKEKNEDKR